MRAVIYARYSSENQREASIEDQVRLCRERIEREGWAVVATYSDAAMSGASRLRPGYQKLLEDARAGRFDMVVAEALDRLSRDQEDVAGLYKQLGFCGVKLVTLAEGEISELHVGLKGTMNALFLKDLAAKTRRGLRGRVEQGHSGGGLCYGYDVVREIDAHGQLSTGARKINEAEAAVVRRIFAAFATGQSPRSIARMLNGEKVPGPGGRPWSDTTIRGHHARRTGLLHNDLYVGRLVWNKQRYVKDPTTGKRLARLNPESDWIVQPVPQLRIIDQDLWQAVQRRLGGIRNSPRVEKARASQFWKNRRAKHLLTGLAHCGACGAPLASIGRDYLACGAARQKGTCDNRRSLPRRMLEDIILDALKERLMAPELVKAFITAYHAEINRQRHLAELDVGVKRRELEEVNRKLTGLIEAIADGLRAPGLQARLDELGERKASLEQVIAAAPAPAPRLHPNLAELYRQKVANLRAALANPATRTEALESLRGLVEKVTVKAQGEGFTIELVGEIARMVAMAAEAKNTKAASKEAAVPDVFACSVKVVAGAGFEPATFRL